MRLQRMLFAGLATLICTAAFAALANAQAVRGVVVDANDRPVPGVVVFLLDSASAVVARALSNERGDFRVAAARAGTYRLRTMRIGFRPTTSDVFALLLGGEVEKRVGLSGVQVSLDTVRVVDRNSCRVASDQAAAATYSAIEQIRTALSAAQITLAGRNISAMTVAYERTLDPDGKTVLRQSSRTTTAYVTQPWRAISPDSAHRAGFVFVANDASTTYFAPSIDVLLSNMFIEDHCFKLVTDRKQPDLVGVAFEPSSDRRKIAELKGTLWMNKKTAELQRLEYRYVNIGREQENAAAGGDASFARLTNGGWVISRWTIRMPVLQQEIRIQALGGTRVSVAEIQMTGGEIQLATRATGGGLDTLWSRPGPTLNGTVVDSARGTPIPNARIDVVGAELSGVTDGDGRFAIRNVLPGTYLVETRTPELEKVGAANQSTIAFNDSTESYRIRVPNAEQLIGALCAGRTLASREAVIVGRVYQRGDTIPAAGARVVAEWTDISVQQERSVVVQRTGRKVEGKTSANGTYRLCGVPMSTPVTIAATDAAASSEPKSVFTGGRVSRADLVTDRAVSLTAKFMGRVLVDSSTTPIEGAEIYFPELSKVGRSVASGAFEISEIPAGEQHVIVRRIGYGILDTRLTFAANTALDRQVFLSRATTLDSVVVTDKLTLNIMRDFEDNRRIGLGHFMDRAQLAKTTPDTHLGNLAAQWPGIQMAFGMGGRMWITGTRKGPPLCAPGPVAPGSKAGSCFEAHGFYVPDKLGAALGEKIACYSQIYIDGVLMNHGKPTPPFEANTMFADQIEAVEWYAGPSETPGKYSNLNAVCGVMVITMRRTP